MNFAIGLIKFKFMKTIKTRNIVIALVAAFILFILLRANEDTTQTFEDYGTHTSYPSFDSDNSYSSSSKGRRLNSNLNRHEILQKKVKGYRESTYWGSEHPSYEKTKDLNNDEFDRFIEKEVEQKDDDIYWGAEY